jgi:hypothetical protein
MSFIVRVTRKIEVPARLAFERLVDHASWPTWMPDSFRPVGPSVGRLVEGAKFRVKLPSVPRPASCVVTVVRNDQEITWCGGIKRVLWAEHRFLFEPKGESSVLVVSAETWSGLLSGVLRSRVEPNAFKGATAQLDALAAFVARV